MTSQNARFSALRKIQHYVEFLPRKLLSGFNCEETILQTQTEGLSTKQLERVLYKNTQFNSKKG